MGSRAGRLRRRLQSVEVNEPSASGNGQDSRAILDAELGEEMAHVDLHRLLADSERRRDFFVPHAFRYQFDDLAFARAQRLMVLPFGEPRLDCGWQAAFAGVDFPDA